jgi:DNA (cytosine-5)-methyltransferase 1
MAGLKVVWGLDFNPNAAETWRANFPKAKMYEMWADEVCRLPDPEGKLVVEVLHLSPPCQVWSPAHTIPGQHDEMNFASLYAVQELLAKAKPRIVTLEQTFGILHDRFMEPFNSLVRMFTDHYFSVSWQVIELQRLGLPQRRKRLIMVAAASVSHPTHIPFSNIVAGLVRSSLRS